MFGYVPPVARMAMSSLRPQAGVLTAMARRPRQAPAGDVAVPTSGLRSSSTRGLILDLDDTLYPRERFVRSGLAAVAQYVSATFGVQAESAYGVMIRALATSGNGFELQALCARFGLAPRIVPELVAVFRSHRPTLFLGRDVADALSRLRAEGWALAILTNGLPSVQLRKVAALGLAPLVDEIIYAEEHAPGGKPSSAPFRAALRSLDLSATQCVSVGDDLARDIHAARALGMATIRVARAGAAAALGDDADIVIDALRQLPDVAGLLVPPDARHTEKMVAAHVA